MLSNCAGQGVDDRATRRQKGRCENARSITRQQLEPRVLHGLKNRLLAPDLIQEFVREFNAGRLQAL